MTTEIDDDDYFTVDDYFYVDSLQSSLRWRELDEFGIGMDLIDLTDRIFKYHDLVEEVQAVRPNNAEQREWLVSELPAEIRDVMSLRGKLVGLCGREECDHVDTDPQSGTLLRCAGVCGCHILRLMVTKYLVVSTKILLQ